MKVTFIAQIILLNHLQFSFAKEEERFDIDTITLADHFLERRLLQIDLGYIFLKK